MLSIQTQVRLEQTGENDLKQSDLHNTPTTQNKDSDFDHLIFKMKGYRVQWPKRMLVKHLQKIRLKPNPMSFFQQHCEFQ